jgi:hypothetical protein
LYIGNVISGKLTDGRVKSTTCFVNSVTDELTPKFSNKILNLYASFGINKPCELAEPSLAVGTVILDIELKAIF